MPTPKNLQSKLEDGVLSFAELVKSVPQLICLIIIVGSFLYYMHSRDRELNKLLDSQDALAIERITACHNVQHLSISAISRLNTNMALRTGTYIEMVESFNALTEIVTKNSSMMEDLIQMRIEDCH